MSDALDRAAEAFSREIGGDAPSPRNQSSDGEKPVESVFNNLDDGEDGGEEGDDTPDGEEAEVEDQEVEEDPEDNDDEGDDEEDDEEDDEDDDGEGEDDDPAMNQKFAIVVDGEESEVTLKEALNGYVRQETFHRRMNTLSEAQKVIANEAQQVIADRQKYMTQLEDLQKQMESLIPQELDWDALYKEDPAKAREIEKQYREYKGAIEKVRADNEAARREAAEADAKATAEFAQQEFPKFARAAKWKTQKDAEKDLNSMRRTALTVGFSEEEIAEVYDSRMLLVLLKASKYDRMMAAKPRPVKDGKPTNKAQGAGRKRTAPKGIDRAKQKLSRSGSIEDAAKVFHRVIQS